MPGPQRSHFMDRFSIKDLELLSGVKAHTIRVWERRYGLLRPERSPTNIRSYGVQDLKTLLNAAMLVQEGGTISAVAALPPGERDALVRGLAEGRFGAEGALNGLKMAMVTYDEAAFERICTAYRRAHGFDALVEALFLPLLRLIGLLWQSNTIRPAQEHFVSGLVRQKLLAAIDDLPVVAADARPWVVLFLPENEIHELGLLHLHYRLRRVGRRTLYLGQSVPLEDLSDVVARMAAPVDLVSVFTVFPRSGDEARYLSDLAALLPGPDIRLHVLSAADPEGPRLDRVQRYTDLAGIAAALAEGIR